MSSLYDRVHAERVTGPWKWVGGKRWLLSSISAKLPRWVRTWHEPFLGGGSIYLGLAPGCPAVLSDGNLHLVDAWRGLQRDPAGAIRQLEGWKARHEADPAGTWAEAKRTAFDYRELPAEVGQVVAAGWFLYAQQAAINGLYRCNASGGLNAALGKTSKGKPNEIKVDGAGIRSVSRALRAAEIRHQPLTAVTIPLGADLGEEDVLVIDSPYLGTFDSYTEHRFDEPAHVALEAYARRQAGRGMPVVLSNSTEALRLYPGPFWRHEIVKRQGTMSAGEDRSAVGEALIWRAT